MSFFENTRKPVGFSGKIMVAMMNFGHSAMAAWGLHFLQPAPDAMVLDCGCGGGANIKTLLKYAEMCRRFLADCEDFTEEKIAEAGIVRRFSNNSTPEDCFSEIQNFVEQQKKL